MASLAGMAGGPNTSELLRPPACPRLLHACIACCLARPTSPRPEFWPCPQPRPKPLNPTPCGAVVPPAYAALNPDMSLSLGQTMALIFPPDDPKGALRGWGERGCCPVPAAAAGRAGHVGGACRAVGTCTRIVRAPTPNPLHPPNCPPAAAEFRATCGQYIKEVFSMPGSIVDQEVGPEAAKEQVGGGSEGAMGAARKMQGSLWVAPALAPTCLRALRPRRYPYRPPLSAYPPRNRSGWRTRSLSTTMAECGTRCPW